ncbi:hypothetical protein E2C01_049164 [Portunus trituberculatus]|uniref:Uncharacterized protein n=1 Tax=Portunus trituberculatus TaxID=210409 RepID=A0A5B7G8H2_PORTR|nr:hypothetical protein [Portunus trituberculatus]
MFLKLYKIVNIITRIRKRVLVLKGLITVIPNTDESINGKYCTY